MEGHDIIVFQSLCNSSTQILAHNSQDHFENLPESLTGPNYQNIFHHFLHFSLKSKKLTDKKKNRRVTTNRKNLGTYNFPENFRGKKPEFPFPNFAAGTMEADPAPWPLSNPASGHHRVKCRKNTGFPRFLKRKVCVWCVSCFFMFLSKKKLG